MTQCRFASCQFDILLPRKLLWWSDVSRVTTVLNWASIKCSVDNLMVRRSRATTFWPKSTSLKHQIYHTWRQDWRTSAAGHAYHVAPPTGRLYNKRLLCAWHLRDPCWWRLASAADTAPVSAVHCQNLHPCAGGCGQSGSLSQSYCRQTPYSGIRDDSDCTRTSTSTRREFQLTSNHRYPRVSVASRILERSFSIRQTFQIRFIQCDCIAVLSQSFFYFTSV